MLSKEQTIAFLTEGDLKQLERSIIKHTLIAPLNNFNVPFITVRGKQMSFFVVLELIGNL